MLIAFVPGYATIGLLAPLAGPGGPAAAGLLGRRGTGRRVGLPVGDGHAGPQGLLRELAVGQPAGRDHGRRRDRLLPQRLTWPRRPIADWGWRIPFFVGCMIVPFIFVIRRSLQETDEFLARKHRPDVREIFHSMVRNWGIVIAGMMLVVMTTVSFYLITVYTPTFGMKVLKLSAADSLLVTFCVGHLELLLAAGDGRAVRPHRPPADAAALHGADARHRLPGAGLAGGRADLPRRCCWWSCGCRSCTAATTAPWSWR